MTPSQLRTYLITHRQATLSDLAIHFQSDPQAIKAAMETWVRKGLVDEQSVQTDCMQGCCQCKPEDITVYRWLN